MDIVAGIPLDVNAQAEGLKAFGFRKNSGVNVGRLAVRFADRVNGAGETVAGGTYTFNGVPVNLYRRFRYAAHRTTFFNRNIRFAFPAERVE